MLLMSTMGGSIAGMIKLNEEEYKFGFFVILPNNRKPIGSKLIYLLGSFMQHGQWKLQFYA